MDAVTVSDTEIPVLGLGTSPMTGETCREAVANAIDLGYRHLDTAQMYENEAAVGAALADTDVPREEFFVVTKVHRRNLAHDDVLESVRASRQRLGTWIDLLLIHGPSRRVPIEESIDAMNRLQEAGDVGHIGVSNFSVEQLEEAAAASETPIVTNQVEYHPFNRQDDLLRYCLEEDVCLTAYSPLAKGRVVGNDVLGDIGDRYGKSEAQVALRWLLQQENVVAIPKAADPTHQAENLDVFDFALTDEELGRIFDLHGGLVETLRRRLGF